MKGILPVVKMILIPGESGPSPTTKTSGCHIVYEDMVKNFQVKWDEVVNELKLLNAASHINSVHFESLVETITGVWTMKPFNKKFFSFSDDDASLSFIIQTVDEDIKTANIVSKLGAPFSNNISTSSMNDRFLNVDELSVLYFSPQQQMIFDNYPRALIRSHAGCGKTLLILLKILDILYKDPSQKIVLVAPYPHNIRCKIILEKNKVTTEMFPLFPYTMPSPPTPFPPLCDVVIIRDHLQISPTL